MHGGQYGGHQGGQHGGFQGGPQYGGQFGGQGNMGYGGQGQFMPQQGNDQMLRNLIDEIFVKYDRDGRGTL